MHDKTSTTGVDDSKSQRHREGCQSKIVALLSACKKSAQFTNSFLH